MRSEAEPIYRERQPITCEGVARRITDVVRVYQDAGYDPRLIGLFGRQASLNTDVPSVTRNNGAYRDIDLTVLSIPAGRDIASLDHEARHIAYPIGLDTFNSLFVNNANGATSIRYKGILLPIDPKVIESREGHLADVAIPTFNPRTLFHLSALYISMRSKDKTSLLQFGRNMRNATDLLPEELFEPFHHMMDIKRREYPLDMFVVALHDFYSNYCPSTIRQKLHPILGKAIMSFWNRDR